MVGRAAVLPCWNQSGSPAWGDSTGTLGAGGLLLGALPPSYLALLAFLCCSAETAAVWHPTDGCVSLSNGIITLQDLNLLEFAKYCRYKIMAVTPALLQDKCSFGALFSKGFGMWHVWPWVEMSACW